MAEIVRMGPDFCTWSININSMDPSQIYRTPSQNAEQAIHEVVKDCKEQPTIIPKEKKYSGDCD